MATRQIEIYEGRLEADSTGQHAHATHQWLRVTEGLMLFEDEHKRYILSGHNAAFIPQGLLHNAASIGACVGFQSIYASPSQMSRVLAAEKIQLPEQIVVFRSSALWRQLLSSLCAQGMGAEEEEPGRTMLRLLWLLFHEERAQVMPIALPQTQEPTLQKALDYLDAHQGDIPTMAKLAKVCHTSTRTLQRLFRRELGCTPFGYVRLQRIFAATIALTTTQDTIVSIAMDVGYESLSAFYAAFTTLTGMTPRQYRQTLGT